MRRTPHVVLALVAAGVVGLSSQGRSVAPSQTRLTHIPRSTVKVEQLIGDYDKERKAATRSQTESRYGVEGTDLGSSFEHGGRAHFLFGDGMMRSAGNFERGCKYLRQLKNVVALKHAQAAGCPN